MDIWSDLVSYQDTAFRLLDFFAYPKDPEERLLQIDNLRTMDNTVHLCNHQCAS